MTTATQLQSAGDYHLDGALIVGSSGKKVNVINMIGELNIYQSLDSPYMSGNIMVTDASGIAENLPLLGQERLLFSLATPGLEGEINFNDYHAIIYNVEKRFQQSDREQVLILNWTTLEHYKNLRTKVSKSFNGNISDMVADILSDKNFLGTKKPLKIEKTRNIRKYVIPNLSPFQAINLLKEEAVSMGENSPHYLFFENPEGIHFRSLDSLIGNMGTLNVPHKITYKSQPQDDPSNIYDSLGTILNWEVDDNSNNFLNVKLGMLSSTLYYHDIFNKNIQKFEYDYNDTYESRNSTNQEDRSSGTLIPQAKIDEKIISEYSNSKIFVHPTASNKLHFDGGVGTDNNAEEWLQESMSRKLQRDYFTLKFETYGNTDIMCGDMIYVQIPSNKTLPSTANSKKEVMDPLLSGRYMVTSIRHKVMPDQAMHSMYMTVMKDSLETAAPVKDLNVSEPPQGAVTNSSKVESKRLEVVTKKPAMSGAQRNAFSS